MKPENRALSRRRVLALGGLGALGLGLGATRAAAEPAFRTGDLIFHSSRSKQSSAIMWATKSLYSHCGIVRVYQGRRYVIEASAQVRVTPFDDFTARGRLGRYAVFRDPRLDAAARERLWRAAKAYVGRPYDVNFLFGNRAIYCSELIHLAYAHTTYTLGEVQRADDLDTDNPLAELIFAKRFKRHPRCRDVASFEACRERLHAQRLITPDAQASDPHLERIYSNYPPLL